MFPTPNVTTEKTSIYNNGFFGIIQGEDILRGDVYGGNQTPIGKTNEAYNDLMVTCIKYYDKLVELGVIEKEKTQEEVDEEQQQALSSLAEQNAIILKQLKDDHGKMSAMMKTEIKEEDTTDKGNTTHGNKLNTNNTANGFKSSASRETKKS